MHTATTPHANDDDVHPGRSAKLGVVSILFDIESIREQIQCETLKANCELVCIDLL